MPELQTRARMVHDLAACLTHPNAHVECPGCSGSFCRHHFAHHVREDGPWRLPDARLTIVTMHGAQCDDSTCTERTNYCQECAWHYCDAHADHEILIRLPNQLFELMLPALEAAAEEACNPS